MRGWPLIVAPPEQYDRAARELLDEPVLACAPCTRAYEPPADRLLVDGAVELDAPRLPQMFLAAATAGALHLLEQPRIRWSPRPRAIAVLASYALPRTRIATEPERLGTRLTILPPDVAAPLALHVTSGPAGDRLLARLGATAPVKKS